jgi:hypothetical protein
MPGIIWRMVASSAGAINAPLLSCRFSLGTFFGQNMATKGLRPFYFSCSSPAKSFSSTTIRF